MFNLTQGQGKCSTHFIRAVVLEKGVLAHLKYVIGFVAAYENQFREIMGAMQKAEIKKEISAKKKCLQNAKTVSTN